MDQTTRPTGKTQRGAGGELHQQSVGEDRPDADIDGFIAAAKTRQWDREPNVRLLA